MGITSLEPAHALGYLAILCMHRTDDVARFTWVDQHTFPEGV
ncbi:hypothetical protein [Yoonia sp.]|nr:hypothetical protein [Yoonia sp.]